METKKQNPLERTLAELRKTCPKDFLFLFRVGGLYEIYGENAKVASKILGTKLTVLGESPTDIQTAFVTRKVCKYVSKLNKAGHRVLLFPLSY